VPERKHSAKHLTLGKDPDVHSECQSVVNRLYNFSNTGLLDPTMDFANLEFLSQRCPRNGNGSALNDLDPTTPDTFDTTNTTTTSK